MQVIGIRGQDIFKRLLRPCQRVAHSRIFLHIQIDEPQVETRSRPIRRHDQDTLQRFRGIRVLVLLQKGRPTIELSQGRGHLSRQGLGLAWPINRLHRGLTPSQHHKQY